jgi:hypothetical protein
VRRSDDGDGVKDEQDDCPKVKSPGQLDTDGDGKGDACQTDALDGSHRDGRHARAPSSKRSRRPTGLTPVGRSHPVELRAMMAASSLTFEESS